MGWPAASTGQARRGTALHARANTALPCSLERGQSVRSAIRQRGRCPPATASAIARTLWLVKSTRWNDARSFEQLRQRLARRLCVRGERAPAACSCSVVDRGHPSDSRPSGSARGPSEFPSSGPVSATSLTVGTLRQTSTYGLARGLVRRRIDQPDVRRQRERDPDQRALPQVAEVVRVLAVDAEVVGVYRAEQRIVRAGIETTARLQEPEPRLHAAPATSWKLSVGMWQSAQARPLVSSPSSLRSKNASSPRATASHGSPPHSRAPAVPASIR